MLVIIINLCITLLQVPISVNSALHKGYVPVQDHRSQLNAQDISLLRSHAGDGDAAAQLKLADAYLEGNGGTPERSRRSDVVQEICRSRKFGCGRQIG